MPAASNSTLATLGRIARRAEKMDPKALQVLVPVMEHPDTQPGDLRDAAYIVEQLGDLSEEGQTLAFAELRGMLADPAPATPQEPPK